LQGGLFALVIILGFFTIYYSIAIVRILSANQICQFLSWGKIGALFIWYGWGTTDFSVSLPSAFLALIERLDGAVHFRRSIASFSGLSRAGEFVLNRLDSS